MPVIRQQQLTQTRKKRVLDAPLKKASGANARRDQVRTLRSRPPLYRFREIFHAIKTGRYPNRTKLATDIEVTTKTIQRDLDYMRYQLGLPIEFDYCRGGYYFTQSVDKLPLFELTEGELVSLFVAQKALVAYKGTAFELPLRNAFDKLSAAASSQLSVSWTDIDSAFSFHQFNAYLPDTTTFDTFSKAISQSRTVEFEYKKLGARNYEKRTVEPWHLACVGGQWYLLAHDLKRNARRVFVLARMRKIERTSHSFEKPAPEILKQLFKDSFQIWQSENSKTYEITLQFDSFAAQLVRERSWHSSQRIQELTNGDLEIHFTLNSLDEILPWIRSWGEHCRVLKPKELLKKLQRVISENQTATVDAC
jgi:predicted DNA-binding transcriptional regulator YafY